MLTLATTTRYIERILSDASGRRFRVIFAISMVDGAPSARIISAQLIGEENPARLTGQVSGQSFCLPCTQSIADAQASHLISNNSFVSPYFSTEFLINSQPTRAPSHS